MPTGFLSHPDFLAHDTGPGHPESAARLTAIIDGLQAHPGWPALRQFEPRPAAAEWLHQVHPPEHLAHVRAAASEGRALTPDTPVGNCSYDAALLAAGALLEACDRVVAGECRNAFCAVRPPGHHAEASMAMGFCLFNNIAVAARYLQANHGLAKVLIADWDVHHGNGTQAIFYPDPTVLYFSVHQYPHYPGTGAANETGEGAGAGATLNVPLPAGAGDAEFMAALEEQLTPAARQFQPDFILISAGFDAHIDDPLSGTRVTEAGFAAFTRLLCELADELCDGRLVSALEGGYNLRALARSVAVHVAELQWSS